jgi:hypothetical protein
MSYSMLELRREEKEEAPWGQYSTRIRLFLVPARPLAKVVTPPPGGVVGVLVGGGGGWGPGRRRVFINGGPI